MHPIIVISKKEINVKDIDFIKIAKQLKEDAKDALPFFPGVHYMTINPLYLAVNNDGSISTSCSTVILKDIVECFILVIGTNNAGGTWYILYYIDTNGIPHHEGYIDDRWSMSIEDSRYSGVTYYDFSLRFDDSQVSKSTWINPKDSEKAFREIVSTFLTLRGCKTLKEAELFAEVIEKNKEMIAVKNRDEFLRALLSKEIDMYKELLDELKH